VNLAIKVGKLLYHLYVLLNPFCFCETEYLYLFAISWISQFPGFHFLLDFAISWISQFPEFHFLLDFAIHPRI